MMFRRRWTIDPPTRTADVGFAVALMDLDKFKEVNDTLGHHNGDLLLQAAAQRLRSTVRPDDIVARLGGDEFGILLSGVADTGTAGALAPRCCSSRSSPRSVAQDLTLEVGASIGIALFPTHGHDADTLIQRADVAMYEAKSGYSGHAVYSPSRIRTAPRGWPCRRAASGHRGGASWRVAYQPKVDLARRPDHRCRGAGPLASTRLRGLIRADEFVPVRRAHRTSAAADPACPGARSGSAPAGARRLSR